MKGTTRRLTDEKGEGAPRTPLTSGPNDNSTPTASPFHSWPQQGNYVYTPKKED